MCIGEQSPESGKIFLNKKSIEEIPIHLRSQGRGLVISQQRSVFDMSVYDNILGIAQMSVKGSINQKLSLKTLDEFNLQHLRTLNASVLSGGEIRRLMMARIMINNPKIVLLDEPLAALGPDGDSRYSKIYIKNTIYWNFAILVTDHNVKNLFDITDRNYVLGEQSVIAEGTSRNIKIFKSDKILF